MEWKNSILTIYHLLNICQEGITDNNAMLDVEKMTKTPGSGFKVLVIKY